MKVMLLLDAHEISEFSQDIQDKIRQILFNQSTVVEQSAPAMPTIQPAPPVTPAAPATVPPPMPPLPPHIANGVRVFPPVMNQPNQQSGAVDVLTGQPVQIPGTAPLPSHVAPPEVPSVMPVSGAVPLMPNVPPPVVNPMPPMSPTPVDAQLPAKSALAVKADAIAMYTSGPQGPQRLQEAMQRWSAYMGTPMTMSGLSDANAPLLQKALGEVSA